MHQSDLGLILKRTAFDERHLLLHILTPSLGCVQCVALNGRGARRFGAGLEFFTVSEFHFFSRNPDAPLRLEQVNVRTAFPHLPQDYPKYVAASFLCELSYKVVSQHPLQTEPLFKLLVNSLATLDSGQVPTPWVLVSFLGKFLQWLGAFPRLAHCAGCGRSWKSGKDQDRCAMLLDEGVWLCETCVEPARPHFPLPLADLATLFMVLSQPIRSLDAKIFESFGTTPDALFDYLVRHTEYHVAGLSVLQLHSYRLIDLKYSANPTNPLTTTQAL